MAEGKIAEGKIVGGKTDAKIASGSMMLGMCRLCYRPAVQTCPLCGGLFCPEHIDPKKHNCGLH